MPKTLKSSLGTAFRSAANRLLTGKYYRLYAPQSDPAAPGDRLRIAIPYLIPNLGDTVMLFPLIDALRQTHPEAEISCFTFGGSRLLALHPAVDRHYEVEIRPSWRDRFGRFGYLQDVYRQWQQGFRALRFHHVLMLRAGVDTSHSAHLGWMLGGQERAGYSSYVEPERAAFDLEPDPLLTLCIPKIERTHETERGSEILERTGLLYKPVDIRKPVSSILAIANSGAAREFVASQPGLEAAYAVIAPGASFARRRWDCERFAEVTRRTIVSRGWLPVLVGGREDLPLCNALAEQIGTPVVNLAGKTNIPQLAAVCAGAQCFLGNDSGTGHVAGACGIPTFVIAQFRRDGPATHHSSAQRTHPLGPHVRVLQASRQIAPCVEECEMEYPHCILDVQVDEVAMTMDEVLSNGKS